MNDYDELKAALSKWPNKTGEPDLEAYADTLITLGEARIWRELRIRGMISTYSRSGSKIAEDDLPSDFLETERIVGPDGESLELRPPDELRRWGYSPDIPTFYAIEGTRILFVPPVDSYQLIYYAKPASLRDTGTNWLFQREPGLWLFASLAEVAVFNRENSQEFERYGASVAFLLDRIREADENSRYPRGQPLRAVVNAGRKNIYTQQSG